MLNEIITYITGNAGNIALLVLTFDRLAKLTPTKWDNDVVAAIAKVLYKVFAILGVKVPDIESLKDLNK